MCMWCANVIMISGPIIILFLRYLQVFSYTIASYTDSGVCASGLSDSENYVITIVETVIFTIMNSISLLLACVDL